MRSIAWKYQEPEATEAMIVAVEHRLGIQYPADFRSGVRGFHGATPSPSRFSYQHRGIGRVGTAIGCILSFDPASSAYVIPTVESHVREGILPVGVVPFGEDGGGDLMAFDFRKDADNPPVVYVAISDAEEEGERHIYPLAPSFSAFLDMLVSDDDHPSSPADRH